MSNAIRLSPMFAAALAVGLGCLLAPAAMADEKADEKFAKADLDFFEQNVRPLLAAQCFSCHGAEKQESELRLDTRESALKGGISGPAVVPGDPGESMLMSAVRHETFEMPPDKQLEDDQIAALERWIQRGAAWTPGDAPTGPTLGDQVYLRKAAATHWAFQPLARPDVPAVKQADWVRNPVDAFVLARLEAAGLRPSPAADRRTLLRRVTFDLIGLPPTAAEIEAFENDKSPDAFRNVVERLLASPQYGERWARHWLDVARYADTRDWQAQTDPRYPFAYTYRDWVIEALNADLPYDQFVRMQIAADAYTDKPNDPNLAALGFLTVGSRFRNNANEQIADRIDVVTRGLMAMTVTCARCHDHKYDPIPTADYYALYGVFGSSEVPEEFPVIEGPQPPAEVVADYEKQRAAAIAKLDEYKEGLREEAGVDLRKRVTEYLLGYYEMNVTRKESIRSLLSKRKLKETAMTPLGTNLARTLASARTPNDPVWGPLAVLAAAPDAKFAAAVKDLDKAPQARRWNALVLKTLTDAPPKDKRALFETYGKLFQQAEDTWQAELKKAGQAKPAALANADLEQVRQVFYSDDSPFAFSPDACAAASRLLGNGRRVLGDLQNAIQEVDMTHPGAAARAMVMFDKDQPITPRIFLRGDPARRGDTVDRRFLSILSADNPQPFTHGSGRRDLAESITDPANPLTTRVLVNRVWMHHFGRGLVNSAGDFGLRTEAPSHPELLDWLASTFIEQGWSLKQLHRLMVLSNAYQQTSEIADFGLQIADSNDAGDASPDPQVTDPKSSNPQSEIPNPQLIDPENRLLWRANRRRLDFEQMRDAILFAGEGLDLTMGGRSVQLSEQPFTRRRTVYGYIDRVNLDPIFSTFDFASPDAPATERAETLVPQQALFAMNHPLVIQQARKLAQRAYQAAPGETAERVKFMYRQAYGRDATPREVNMALRFIEQTPEETASTSGWSYGYGPTDRDPQGKNQFTPLTFWTGSAYQIDATYPNARLGHVRWTATGGNPVRGSDQSVILRWTAKRAGTIQIQGTITQSREPTDGVHARIVAGRGGLLKEATAMKSSADMNVEQYDVAAGETIDFLVDCIKTASNDSFVWTPVVRMIGPVPAGAEAMAMVPGQTIWDAKADFAAPPPPPLSAWEQVAQALLLTNEFWYVD